MKTQGRQGRFGEDLLFTLTRSNNRCEHLRRLRARVGFSFLSS
jgi:hypothetical protein